MTDNEIIFCFQHGCALLNNDDVDNKDIEKIKNALIMCSKNMLPIIHKYTDGKTCDKCEYNNTRQCEYRESYVCRDTIDRPFFKLKRRLEK